MIDWHTPLGHHLFEIAVAHPVAAVPPHRPQDDVTGEMPTGEDAHGRDYFTPVFLLPQLCNSTIEFAKREDYWGAPAQRDAAIRYFADAVSAVSALRVGDIDVVWSMQAPELIETLPEAIGVEVSTTNGEMLLSLKQRAGPVRRSGCAPRGGLRYRPRRAQRHSLQRHGHQHRRSARAADGPLVHGPRLLPLRSRENSARTGGLPFYRPNPPAWSPVAACLRVCQ